jgi:hypothetical protein
MTDSPAPVRRRAKAPAVVLAALMAGVIAASPAPSHAAPGAGEEVYAATVEPGEWELEARYGRLAGSPDANEDNLRLEAGYGVTGKLRLAAVGEFEREAGGPHKATAFAIEAVYHLAHARGWDFAVYGEFEKGLNGHPDAIESKLLIERSTRNWDLRANLIAEQPLRDGEQLELGYAVSLDRAVSDAVRLGVVGFGELGDQHRLFPFAQHYWGPAIKWRPGGTGHPLKLEAGWLVPLAEARDHAKGQLHLQLEWEL